MRHFGWGFDLFGSSVCFVASFEFQNWLLLEGKSVCMSWLEVKIHWLSKSMLCGSQIGLTINDANQNTLSAINLIFWWTNGVDCRMRSTKALVSHKLAVWKST
jgi:hypothetical protein